MAPLPTEPVKAEPGLTLAARSGGAAGGSAFDDGTAADGTREGDTTANGTFDSGTVDNDTGRRLWAQQHCQHYVLILWRRLILI